MSRTVPRLLCSPLIRHLVVAAWLLGLGRADRDNDEHGFSFLSRPLQRHQFERCWPATASTDSTEGPTQALRSDASGKVSFDQCITHSLDHEWNYYHMFERNLFGIFHAVRSDGRGHYIPPADRRASEKRNLGVILEGQINTNFLRPWMNTIMGSNFVTLKSPDRPEVCCRKMMTSRGTGWADWEEVVPRFRDFMYEDAGVSLLQQSEAAKKVCFLNRNTAGRGRSFLNQDELIHAAKQLSFESELLLFEGKSPAEQVQMTSGCDVAIGIHGAGLTNFIWMKPGALAIQILPYQSSSPLLGTLHGLATAAGLMYREWEPKSYKQVQVHWEQMKSDKHILDQVCRCGVRSILEYGTKFRCNDAGVEYEFLNWGFYLNQDVEVPADDFKRLLEPATAKASSTLDAEGPASVLEVSLDMQTVGTAEQGGATNSRPQAFGEVGSSLWAEDGAMAQQLVSYKATVDDFIERLNNMPVEEAEELCNTAHSSETV